MVALHVAKAGMQPVKPAQRAWERLPQCAALATVHETPALRLP